MTQTQTMSSRPLGSSGLQVSEIGFGGWGIGKSMWGRTYDEESLNALRTALDRGITYFDTAGVYGHGHSERLIGQAIRDSGAKAVVGTKIAPKNMEWPAHPRTRLPFAFPADWITEQTERSLRNLRSEAVDLLMLHVWTDAWLDDENFAHTARALEDIKSSGKARAIGISINSDDPSSALRLIATGRIDAVQVIFNLFDQRAVDELFPLCQKMGVGVIVRCPFDEGGLTGQLRPDTQFAPEDFRSFYFGGERLGETVKRAEVLKGLLIGEQAQDLAQAALKYCLSDTRVATVIPGMRLRSHVEANARVAGGKPFDKATLEALKAHRWIRNFYS
jgi:aryl-alcohol dehydrogenase-like predicted oxidoreductase